MSNTYPDCYLHVEECRSGETWIVPLRGNSKLDLKHQVQKWIAAQYGPDMKLDGDLMPKLSGDYYARIMTDGRPPDSVVCRSSGGFYLKSTHP
jgi:hypothetical protein